MNIVKLQNDLKGAPDQALIGYVQNPNGQVPSYLALSEIKRRTEMRKQADSEQAQGPQPSVAEQLVSEVQPQMPQMRAPVQMADRGGLTSLPISNVGNEEAYATGGIVAFEDGGDVQSYADGRRVSSKDAYQLEQERAEKEREVLYANMQDAILGFTGTPSSWRYGLTGGHLGSRYKPVTPEAEAGYNKQLETQADAINRAKYPASMQSVMPAALSLDGAPYASDPRYSSYKGGPEDPRQFSYVQNPTNVQDNLSKGIVEGKFNKPKSRPTAQPTESASGLRAPVVPYTPMTEADMTPAGDSRSSMKEYQDLIGVDPYTAKAKERIGAMEAENEAFKAQYPWMALAEAGFNIAAGQSPNAISNIAQGGIKGVAALGAGRKESRDQQDKIINAEAKVAEAERAVQLKAAEFGVTDSRTKEAARRLEKAEDRKTKLQIDMKNKEFEAETEMFKITEARQSEADRNTAAYRTESLGVERERNQLTKESTLQTKTVEMYNKARDNAQIYVKDMVASGAVSPQTQADYENLIAIQYAKELNNLGLPALTSMANTSTKTYNPKTRKLE